MRQTFKPNHFDLITNLFTSFGYFNNSTDNMRVMQSVWEGLKPNGIFVLDFMNAQKVIDELTHQEHIVKGDLTFNISRKLENNVIVKLIDFEAEGKHHHFEERVTGFSLQDLQELFEPCCLKIEAVFGDYELGEFNEHKSPRLILVARKV
jgi:SAM-dependent methyltransferase